MSDRDLCFTPATELQRLYRTGKTSPLEVMQAVLARVARREVEQAQMDWLFNINFWGVVHGTRAFLPILHGQPVLYAGQDRYAAYELLGAGGVRPS